MYAAPTLGYSGVADGNGNNGGYIRAGGLAGYQFIFGGGETGFALDLNAGILYRSISGNGLGTLSGGVGATFGLSIGYAF